MPDVPPKIPDHQLLHKIGAGSYGQVWLARNTTGAYRAVKIVFRSNFERDRPYEREFEGIRKFEPVSRSHPGLIDILHIGRNEAADYFYYIMELADPADASVSGDSPDSAGAPRLLDSANYVPRTLAVDLRRRGRLPFQESVQLGLLLTDALGYLHDRGLVHRDVKPSNIIFVAGVPKLADIGLVTDAGQTLSCVGTEGFIPPEGPGSPQADLYSLGKVLYEISTGKDRHDYPAPLTNLGQLPEQEDLLELNEIIFKACAPEPRQRYASAEAMHRDLALVRSGRSVKKLRLLERRVAWGTRVGCGVGVLLLVVGGGYLEARHTRKIATERLVRLEVSNAVQRMDAGDLTGALPWIAESVRLARGNPADEEMHRYRFASVWSRCPKLSVVGLHQDRINEVAFNPEGSRFVTASADHTAQVWDAANGQKLLPALRHEDEVLHALYSPDGRKIVTVARDATLHIWDAATGRPACAPAQSRFHISCVTFSPDGGWILTGGGVLGMHGTNMVERELGDGRWIEAPYHAGEALGEARIWDSSTGKPVGRPFLQAQALEDATFSPDGRQVVTASDDGTAIIWDVKTGEPVVSPLKHRAKVRRALFSPDGQCVLTASEDHTAQLWDAHTGQRLGLPLRHGKGVLYAAFSPDGSKIVTTSRDQTACVWDAVTGQLICLPLRHESDVWYAEFSPDGHWLLTAGSEAVVRIWDTVTGQLLARLRENNGGTFAKFGPRGRRVVTVSRDRLARLWNLMPLSVGTPCLQHGERVNSALFNRQGTWLVTACADQTARVWNATNGTPITPLFGHPVGQPPISGFRAIPEPDGHNVLVVDRTDGGALLCDAAIGKPKLNIGAQEGRMTWADFSADGKRIVTANINGKVEVWDARSGRSLLGEIRHAFPVTIAVFSPDGRYIATSSGEHGAGVVDEHDSVLVWDSTTGRRLSPVVMAVKGLVSSLSFNPDGSRLLTAAQEPALEPRAAQVWDWRAGRPAGPPLQHVDGISWAVFSPDGRRVATASFDKTARIWDSETGRPLTRALQHTRQVEHIVFSPDGRLVATACQDGTARVWDAATGEPISLPLTHSGPVWWVDFSPDGQRLATASGDHSAKIWELSKTTWPVNDLKLFAEIMSGREFDTTGSPTPMSPEELLAAWQNLRRKYPACFEGDTASP